MKIKNKIAALLAAIGFLTACSDDIANHTYTVGEADNAIVLGAGISEGGAGVMTRANISSETDHHSAHKTFQANTKLTLRVDGTWTGKADETIPLGTISGGTVSQTATATIGDAFKVNSDTKYTHNKVSFDTGKQLYWDDYGTADPANASTGRTTGLTIFGAAVDDASASAPTVSNWTALTWSVGDVSNGVVDQSTNGWSDKDLLTSNNVQAEKTDVAYATDGTFKFDSNPRTKLLEFTHAMSKITVNLTAGEGFPGYETDASSAKFQQAPKVTLLQFYYTGTYNVEDKTPAATTGNKADIKAWINGGVTWTSAHTAQATALVFPGNQFTANIASDGTATSATEILKVEADGNVYYVTAAQLVKAIAKKDNGGSEPSTGEHTKTLEQGVNYILNVKVNKTKIIVEATIKDWDEIDAEETAPVINISANYGQTTSAGVGSFTKTYDFFRSTTIASGYDEDNNAAGINPAARFTYDNGSYTQDKVLYWPNHDTHYFFRGVYPVIATNSTGYTSETALAISTNSSSKEVIAVENVAYTADTWPSDLAIALPRTTNTACDAHSKTPLENGICATKGTITMNFEYAMSKVEVRLKSSANTTDPEYVDLNNITVEVVGGYNKGRITLEDGLHDTWDDNSDKGDYTLNQLTTPATGFSKTTLDAIIPQTLGNDVKFKITVTNSDDTKDIYYAQLNKIKGKKAGADDSTKAEITEWKHGEHYIYELTVTKTQINVTATLTDWKVVEASENIWF